VSSMGWSTFDFCESMTEIYMDEASYTNFTGSMMLGSDVVRYNYTYNITFDANGGTVDGEETATAYYGIAFSFDQTATYDGYDFTGWYTAADDTGTAVTSGETWTYRSADSSDVTLYAQWELDYVFLFAVLAGITISVTTAALTYHYRKSQ
jgi:uncharacterized repeat protein (TIGR02543 family)